MRDLLKISLAIAFGIMILSIGVNALAQEEMTMEEYQAQLQQWQQREADAKAEIAKCDEDIANLQNQLTSLDQQIDNEWNEIYALVGSDKAGVDAYRNQLNALSNQVDGLMAISPEELFKRREELDQLEEQLGGMKENNIYALTEMQNLVASIEGKITQLRNRMPKAIYDEYVVMRGDYLWKISGKSDIYGDPYQWVRIYSYNRDQIKDPDLIYPDQVFKIQREVGPDEYLVVKGDFLAKIAGNAEIFSDPTQWAKIYEANKDIVGSDPSMIYPYQVLKIPK